MAPSSSVVVDTALAAVRFFGPAILLLIVLSLATLRAQKVAPTAGPIVDITVPVVTPRRTAILTLLSIAALTYLLDGTVVVLRAVLWKQWEPQDKKWRAIEEADVVGLLAFGLLVIVGTWKDAKGIPVWTSKRVKAFAIVAVVFEIAQVALLGVTLSQDSPSPSPPPHIPENPPPPGLTLAPFLHIALSALRLLTLLPLVPVISRPITVYVAYSDRESSDATAVNGDGGSRAGDSSGLLAPIPTHARYGTFLPPPSTTPSIHTNTRPPSEAGIRIKPTPVKEKSQDPNWRESFARIRKLLPFLWPHKSIKLQFLASLCMVILLVSRVVNVLLPLTIRQVVDDLDKGLGFPLGLLFVYAGLRFLQGSGGLNALRDVIWAPVMQYSDREMSQLSFDHLLNLSLAFHTRRKTGEVLRILDRGAAINHVFEVLLFQIVPTVLDIVIAIGTFFYFFGYVLSAVVAVVMITYIGASVLLTNWRTKLRRAMNERDIITRGIHTDCLLNYDTVKYFTGEAHEGERYRDAIAQYQALEFKVITSLNLLNFIQNFIISTGLLVGSLIIAWRVVHSSSNAADFVFFITYLAQLYGPLNMLGYIYRSINQNLVDTEKLLNLLNEPTEVNDKPDAPPLDVTDGVITFENVNFSYDDKTTALQDVSFTVPKGNSVALVGESGSGKSTILRLLFRQYDLKEGQGRILIDGQDIRDVTQKSLRQAIGVVPQDSVLFNASIAYNIGYGKFGATQEEIETAATAAQMHERISSFPDQYETKVGERGVRLSGGEKQRVSIARTFLKNSPILALDEATSALDTATERDIQTALQNLLHGRTSISIAHRLSTIASADIILVLKDGMIVESGNHKELLAKNGFFAEMWEKQITSNKDGETGPFDGPPVGGYEIAHEAMATDATVTAPAPQVMPETEQSYFIMPGPALVPLPPTEAELKAEAAEAEPSFVDNIQHASDGPSVQAPSTKEEETADQPATPAEFTLESPPPPAPLELPVDKSTAPSVKAPSEIPAPAVPGEAPGTYSDVVVDEPKEESSDLPPQPISPGFTFPSSTATPVGFPTSDDASSRRGSIAPTPGSITFKDQEHPAGPADKKDEPKRKRISSQNFQRLARRISLGGRKASSSSNILAPGDAPSRDGSVDLGSSGPGTPGSGTGTPSMSAVVQAAAAAAMSGSDTESAPNSIKDNKRSFLRKKPTKSKTGF